MRTSLALAASAALLCIPANANATSIADPTGDFLATYTGPANADLDITGASVQFDGTQFLFSSTSSGAIGSTAGSLFVWGVNRGSGTPRLTFGSPSIGSGILFDGVVVLFPDGTLRIVSIPAVGAPTITNILGGASVSGNSISGAAPLSLLFSTGFGPLDYDFTLWSRARVNPALDGLNSEIADFAPGQGAIRASLVPEPATWLSMILGFALAGTALRTRRRHAAAA